jgi:hypothetical protein
MGKTCPKALPRNFLISIYPPAPLMKRGESSALWGDVWRAICVYFRTVFSRPEVRSLLYQLKSLCSQGAET